MVYGFVRTARLLAVVSVAIANSALADSPAQPVRPPVLNDWLNDQFTSLGQNCLGDNFKVGRGKAAPSTIRNVSLIASNLNKPIVPYPNKTIGPVFAEVLLFKPDGAVDPSVHFDPLPIPWRPDAAPIFDVQMSDARFIENCTSLVAHNADISASIAILKSALSEKFSDDKVQTANLFVGKMISPFALALSRSGTFAPQGGQPPTLPTLLAIWDWYYRHPDQSENAQLGVRDTVNAISIYWTTGISEKKLLEADANVRFGLPFLSVGGGGKMVGDVARETGKRTYQTAIFAEDSPSYVRLPTARSLSESIMSLGRLELASDNPTFTDNGDSFVYQAVLRDIPESMCRPSIWHYSNSGKSGSAGTQGQLQVKLRDDGSCLFGMTFVPPTTSNSSSFKIDFGITQGFKGPSDWAGIAFIKPGIVISDLRAAISLKPRDIQGLQKPIAASPVYVKLNITFDIARNGPLVEVVGVDGPNSALTISCGHGLKNAAIDDDGRIEASRRLDLEVGLPVSVFSTSADSETCQLDGHLNLRRRVGSVVSNQDVIVPTMTLNVAGAVLH